MTKEKLDLDEGSQDPYTGPSGGYGSLKSVTEILVRERIPVKGTRALVHQNKPKGFMCVSCAWAKPAKPHPAEFCENGAKATAWEITDKTTDQKFFARHTLTELETWRDYDLEEAGRLTHPMRWDPDSDRYMPVSWEIAFQEIARELQAVRPEQAVFYTSGRASLETSYMYQLFARMYGSNHLPDCSNMCHESSSVALPASIGAAVGTATLSDFDNCELIFYIAQNVATSSPRMLHQLQEAVERGVKIITINPLRERGLERFTNPQAPDEMMTGAETVISSQYMQVKNGGDIAALFGICKAVIAMDDAAQAGPSKVIGEDGTASPDDSPSGVVFAAAMAAADTKRVLDWEFIHEHTAGFEEFAAAARGHDWAELERVSGLTRDEMTTAAEAYVKSSATLGVYGMGLTQHAMGVENVHMVTNLLLLRGNIGKPGGNVCPVRGHSNVQGQRTVGITEKPELAPLDQLEKLYGFKAPRWTGHSTVDACKAIMDGEVRSYIGLGGNFLRAIPETAAMETAWRRLRLTVQIATKLNRNHVVHGEIAYLLPCLGRIEKDVQATGPQAVSMESSVAHFHGSHGLVDPVSEDVRSEAWIVAGMAKETLPPNPNVPWDEWVGDYANVRDAIEATYPDTFKRFNERFLQPGGFARPLPARERKWVTRSGKANFITPDRLFAGIKAVGDTANVLQLATLRSNDQFNTTVYGYTDRFRGVEGTRHIIFMNPADIARMGLAGGDAVDLTPAIADDGHERMVNGLQVVPYNIPEGCAGAYFPECNPLFPLWHHDQQSKVPGYKALPVRVVRSATGRVPTRDRDGLQAAAE